MTTARTALVSNEKDMWTFYFPEYGEKPEERPEKPFPDWFDHSDVAEWAHEWSDSQGDYSDERRVCVRRGDQAEFVEFIVTARAERSYHAVKASESRAWSEEP